MLEDFSHDPEFLMDLNLTRHLVDCVAKPIQDVLDFCGLTLLRHANGNVLLMTWYSDDHISPQLLARLPIIATVVHHQHGRTQIYLRHHQKDLIMRWDSQTLRQQLGKQVWRHL